MMKQPGDISGVRSQGRGKTWKLTKALTSCEYEQRCLMFPGFPSEAPGAGALPAGSGLRWPSEGSDGFGSHLAAQGQAEVRDGENHLGAGHG